MGPSPFRGRVNDAFIAALKGSPFADFMRNRGSGITLTLADFFNDPRFDGGSDYDVFDPETVRTTDAFGVRVSKRGQQLDTSADIGGVQSGGARRRRTRARRQGRSKRRMSRRKSVRGRSRVAINLRAQIRLRH